MNLITDRTTADVTRWRQLHDKGWAAMSQGERNEWLGFMKGRYNREDMNRVENAVKSLLSVLHELGYCHSTLTVKTDWDRWDCPTRADMIRYLGNVAELRNCIPLPAGTPAAPTVSNKFDHNRANDVEKILVNIDKVTTAIPQAWYCAGDLISGEV